MSQVTARLTFIFVRIFIKSCKEKNKRARLHRKNVNTVASNCDINTVVIDRSRSELPLCSRRFFVHFYRTGNEIKISREIKKKNYISCIQDWIDPFLIDNYHYRDPWASERFLD